MSEDNKKVIYIPRGFAHGFCTLSEISEVVYKVDNYYSKESECGLLWNDKQLNIDWPFDKPILSDKDQKNITINEFKNKYKAIKNHEYKII